MTPRGYVRRIKKSGRPSRTSHRYSPPHSDRDFFLDNLPLKGIPFAEPPTAPYAAFHTVSQKSPMHSDPRSSMRRSPPPNDRYLGRQHQARFEDEELRRAREGIACMGFGSIPGPGLPYPRHPTPPPRPAFMSRQRSYASKETLSDDEEYGVTIRRKDFVDREAAVEYLSHFIMLGNDSWAFRMAYDERLNCQSSGCKGSAQGHCSARHYK